MGLQCVQLWGVDSFLVVWSGFGMLMAMLRYLKSALEFNKIFAVDLFTFFDSWDEKARWLQWLARSQAQHAGHIAEIESRILQIEHATARLQNLISPVRVFGIAVTPALQKKVVSVFASIFALVAPQLVHFIGVKFFKWMV